MFLRLRRIRKHANLSPLVRHLHHTTPSKMRIIPVPIRSDNYMYILSPASPLPQAQDNSTMKKCPVLLVDPGSPELAYSDPPKVKEGLEVIQKAALDALGQSAEIVGILTTHGHQDHGGGNAALAKAAQRDELSFPKSPIPVYGGSEKNAVNHLVKDGSEITFENITIKCLATPCHTKDSICYYVTSGPQKAVFTGDTLFQAGCGRFFEGTAGDMRTSLSYLGQLPEDTVVYPGHEYTSSNLKFAKTVEPDNQAFEKLERLVQEEEITAGKSTIGDEKKWNVFMRLENPAVRKATSKTDPLEVMDKLREMKNNFK